MSSNRKPGDRRGWPHWISRQKFPKRTRILCIPIKPYTVHSVHSAIGNRMNGMIFRSFQKRNSFEKNTLFCCKLIRIFESNPLSSAEVSFVFSVGRGMGRGEITRAGAGEKVTRFALCSRFPAISPLKKSLRRREKQTGNVEH